MKHLSENEVDFLIKKAQEEQNFNLIFKLIEIKRYNGYFPFKITTIK